MVALVIVLAVVAAAAIVTALVLRAQLLQQRRLVTAADERAAQQAEELAGTNRTLEAARQEHAGALEQIRATDARAAAFESERDRARTDTEVSVAARMAAEERADAAERRTDELALRHADASAGSVDAEVLWALERQRSARVWRLAVATAPDAQRVSTDAPLLDALHIEIDAAREEVGAIVDLEADLPAEPSAASSLLTLRAAQELLAGVVRRADETTLRVRADGRDILVSVESTDAEGDPVTLEPLAVPASVELEAAAGQVRLRNAVRG